MTIINIHMYVTHFAFIQVREVHNQVLVLRVGEDYGQISIGVLK